jgi:immunoglobulin-binding protein 1
MQSLLQTITTRHRVPLPSSDTSPTDFDFIAALLPPSAPSSTTVGDEDDDEDDRRTATLLLLRLAHAQAHAQLASITQELELLRSAPPAPPLHQPGTSDHAGEAERALWTLDAPRSIGTAQRGGPLLDSAGKVCGQCGALFWAFLLTGT